MSDYRIRHHNEMNPLEIQCIYDNGTCGTVFVAKYKFDPKKKKAHFGYWRKDLETNRWKMIGFTVDDVVSISLILQGVAYEVCVL